MIFKGLEDRRKVGSAGEQNRGCLLPARLVYLPSNTAVETRRFTRDRPILALSLNPHSRFLCERDLSLSSGTRMALALIRKGRLCLEQGSEVILPSPRPPEEW